METVLQFATSLAAIMVINLVLSGDNAIVIALAARNVPAHLQKRAIVFGTVGAVLSRVVMTLAVVWLLKVPGLLFVGGVALIWIGYNLLIPAGEGGDSGSGGQRGGIWGAIRMIVVADVVMGVDNVLGVAGAAQGSYVLVMLGLLTSIPIVVWGSAWLLKWVERYPAIVYVGAGVLLWTAAGMIAAEPLAEGPMNNPLLKFLLYSVVVCGVLWAGFVRNHRHLESRIHARLEQLRKANTRDTNDPLGGLMNTVLVPVSDLPNSHDAVRRVVDEFRRNPAMCVHLINVRRPLSQRVAHFIRRSLREEYHRERAEIALKPARDLLERHHIPYTAHMQIGDAATVITAKARELGCDHIVMSTARRGSITRMLEASTTERVLDLTTVPVELVVGNAVSSFERFAVPAVIGSALAALVVELVMN